jgi:hypothetical protein
MLFGVVEVFVVENWDAVMLCGKMFSLELKDEKKLKRSKTVD